MKKKIVWIGIFSVSLLLLGGCGSQTEKTKEENTIVESTSQKNDTTASQAESTGEADASAGDAQEVDLEEAKEIAVEHAGLSMDEATFKKAGKDWDNGQEIYDIEFYSGTTEYEYEILVGTGEILKHQMELEEGKAQDTGEDASAASSGQNQAEDQGTTLTESQAKDAAFEHAGISADEAEQVEVERDRENGVLVYDVSFDSGNQEYDYEVDAQTGEILHYEKETRD